MNRRKRIRRYDVPEPRNESERKALCGFNHAAMEAYWDKRGDMHQSFFLAQQTEAPPDTVRLWELVIEVTGEDPDITPQPTGNCFLAGTMVMMADGTEKPIETVKVGESVITHTGKTTKVIRTIENNYSGDIHTIRGALGFRPISATPDHQFIKFNDYCDSLGGWTAADRIDVGDRVLVPSHISFNDRCERLDVSDVCGRNPNQYFNPGSVTTGCIQDAGCTRGKTHDLKNRIEESVVVDGDFGRLVGLYLAEGGADENKVQFSFSADEADTLVVETQSLLKSIFSVDSVTRFTNKRNTGIAVVVYSTALVTFLQALIPGNVYSKRIPDIIKRAPAHVRVACLRGWLDGDGHLREAKRRVGQKAFSCVGITSSHNLSLDMQRLGISIGVRPSLQRRKKARHQRVAANVVQFSQDSCSVLYPEKVKSRRMRSSSIHGFRVRVAEKTVSTIENGFVYCLEVAHQDHSFIANGYAVHNCVAAACGESCEVLQCSEIAAGQDEEFRRIFNPFHYATGRVLVMKNSLRGQAGANGGAVAEAMKLHGVIQISQDLPVYNKANVDAWGDGKSAQGKSFRDFLEEGAKTVIQSTARITSMSHLFESLGSRYPLTIASNTGYSMKPDRDGFHRVSTAWSHQMSIWGYSISGGWVGIKNQWGDVHGDIVDQDGEEWPPGFLKVRIDEFEKRHFRGAEVIAYSNFKGFPQRKYDHRALA